MNIRKFRHAAVLAAEGHYGRAAEKLHITQSALSQSVAQLEQEVGLKLFERGRKGAVLSSTGKEFMARIEPLLLEMNSILRDLSLIRTGEVGEVAFGIRPTAANCFLGRLLLNVNRAYPSLRIHVETGRNEELVEQLLHEKIEFALIDSTMIPRHKALHSQMMTQVPLNFYVRKEHPLVTKSHLKLDDLRGYPIAATSIDKMGYEKARDWLQLGPGDDLPITITCDEFTYLKDLILGGDAILIAPQAAVLEQWSSGALAMLAPQGIKLPGRNGICLVSIKGRELSPAASRIVFELEKLIGETGFSFSTASR